jgi:predicted deacetylase
MSAQYLVRIDDICPTLNWTSWNEIEKVLIEANVKPILAVIPDNQDPQLMAGRREERFWERALEWQARGWTIGLHGYQHRFVTGDGGIIGAHARSEFAGLPREEQAEKLKLGCAILRQRGLDPQVWVAPAHSFDWNTVAALKTVGVRAISDGFGARPWNRDGMLWIPQQIGQFRSMPFGLWTVCIHVDDPPYHDSVSFRQTIARFRNSIVSFPEIAATYADRVRTPLDGAVESLIRAVRRTRVHVRAARRRMSPGAGVLPAAAAMRKVE